MVLEIGAKAPGFSLSGVDGKMYSLRDSLSAGSLLLVFFKTGCGACDLAFPYINRLSAAYREGLQIWAVAQEGFEKAGGYARSQAATYPVLPDTPDYEVSRRYDPLATPTFFFLSADGNVIYTSHGFSKDDLNELSGLIANQLGVEVQEVVADDDGRPDFRPG